MTPSRHLRPRLPAILPPLCALVGCAIAAAQAAPVGSEFPVNDFATGSQRYPRLERASDGGFVVAWQSYGSASGDHDEQSVQARRFAADGEPLGAQFQVNGYTTGHQYDVDVAVAPDGRFVVVWQSDGSSGGDTSLRSIQARRFAADGTPAGSEFQVNTYTTSSQSNPAVAIAPGGQFVVVWNSSGSSGGDDSGYSVQGRRFAANGLPAGPDFQLNSYTPGPQGSPDVALLPGGGFVATWSSYGSGGSDVASLSIQVRRFASDGDPIGADVQVNSHTPGHQQQPAVAVAPDGRFVIAWDSQTSSGSDDSASSVQARRFAADGAALGAEFQVNTYTAGYQDGAAVAIDGRGDFVVAWASYDGDDGSESGIQAQRFRVGGGRLGGEFQVNSHTESYQASPSVDASANGDFVVAWQSYGASYSSLYGIQAQRFQGLFADGFESGDAARWSSIQP